MNSRVLPDHETEHGKQNQSDAEGGIGSATAATYLVPRIGVILPFVVLLHAAGIAGHSQGYRGGCNGLTWG
jgi:hypothetical protein